MNKEEVVQMMVDGFIEDMKGIYSSAGISDEESDQYIEQGLRSFSLICNNTYDRLLEKSIINS